jgi:hypothetical protein
VRKPRRHAPMTGISHTEAVLRPLIKTTGPAISPSALGSVDVVLIRRDEHMDNLDVEGRRFASPCGQCRQYMALSMAIAMAAVT